MSTCLIYYGTHGRSLYGKDLSSVVVLVPPPPAVNALHPPPPLPQLPWPDPCRRPDLCRGLTPAARLIPAAGLTSAAGRTTTKGLTPAVGLIPVNDSQNTSNWLLLKTTFPFSILSWPPSLSSTNEQAARNLFHCNYWYVCHYYGGHGLLSTSWYMYVEWSATCCSCTSGHNSSTEMNIICISTPKTVGRQCSVWKGDEDFTAFKSMFQKIFSLIRWLLCKKPREKRDGHNQRSLATYFYE
jgi:hypothetical protein